MKIVSSQQEAYMTAVEQRLTAYKQADVRKNLGECGNYVIAQFSQASRTVHIQRSTIQTSLVETSKTTGVATVTFHVDLDEHVPMLTHACKKVHFIINWGCKCGQCSASEHITGTISVTVVFDCKDQANVVLCIPRDPPTMNWDALTLSPFQCQGSVFGIHFHHDYTAQLKAELQVAVTQLDANFISKYVPTADPIFSTPA